MIFSDVSPGVSRGEPAMLVREVAVMTSIQRIQPDASPNREQGVVRVDIDHLQKKSVG
jgi:hypothetical protein